MEICFATTNKGKVESLQKILSAYGITVVHHALILPEPRSDDLKIISTEKVLFAYEKLKRPCLAMDAGFYVHSLNGFPRAFVNFALETIGIEGILRLVEEKPRDCEFKNCLAYIDSALKEPVFFESRTPGILVDARRGVMKDYFWNELFMIFAPTGHTKTLSEMTYEEYHAWRISRPQDSCSAKFGEWITRK